MVSDGMNNGTFSAANHWLNLKENRNSEWMQLYSEKLASRHLVETSCADSLVTDSAAASSAWGIGKRVNMGSINTMPDGSMPDPLAVLAKKAGKLAGMVTTATITHATPAGFAANVVKRSMQSEIAVQYLERRLDVLLGGGDKYFDPSKRKDWRNMYSEYEDAGYCLLRDRNSLNDVKSDESRPLLGVFSDGHIPYCIDRTNNKTLNETVPSLEEMTKVALDRLDQGTEGFVLQIEAGRVDHAAHGNDPAALIFEQLEFDRTIALVRKFAEENGETMVVVTTDHGTGGFMINGADDGYHFAQERFLSLANCKGSYESVEQSYDENPGADIVALIEANFGIVLNEKEKANLLDAMKKDSSEGLYSIRNAITDSLYPILFRHFSVSWTSHNHTADLVEMAMFGPGSDILPGFVENWEVNKHCRKVLGI